MARYRVIKASLKKKYSVVETNKEKQWLSSRLWKLSLGNSIGILEAI